MRFEKQERGKTKAQKHKKKIEKRGEISQRSQNN